MKEETGYSNSAVILKYRTLGLIIRNAFHVLHFVSQKDMKRLLGHVDVINFKVSSVGRASVLDTDCRWFKSSTFIKKSKRP